MNDQDRFEHNGQANEGFDRPNNNIADAHRAAEDAHHTTEDARRAAEDSRRAAEIDHGNEHPAQHAYTHEPDHEQFAHEQHARDTEEATTRRIVREEIARNYRPKGSAARTLAIVLCSALLGAGGGAALVASGNVPLPKQEVRTADTATNSNVNISLKEGSTTVENAIAAKTIPSIVGITTVSKSFSDNPFLYGTPQYSESVGSGVIVSPDGYILTNAHVVNGGNAKTVQVRLSNGEEAEANVLWADPTLDLAVIKVEKNNLPAITFGDAKTVQVGDKAVAIGNPLGLDLQSTLTSGYISGLNRSITLQDGNIMDGLIQTDAAINGGNSGGALLNANGELIGINTAKPASADGIGFAIPVSTVKPIVEKIVADGTYTPLYMGINATNTKLVAASGVQGLPTDSGVVVRDVVAGSPAADMGIEAYDIIVAINDEPVESMNTLKTLLLKYKKGDTVDVTYYHGKEKKTGKMTFTDFLPPTMRQ